VITNGAIDVNLYEAGTTFSNLNGVTSIIICTSDMFAPNGDITAGENVAGIISLGNAIKIIPPASVSGDEDATYTTPAEPASFITDDDTTIYVSVVTNNYGQIISVIITVS